MAKYTDRHYTRTTANQTKWLKDLQQEKNFNAMSDAIRYCVDRTIEDESDAIGSRRHFNRTMNQKLDQVLQAQQVGIAMVIMLISEMLTALINMLNEDDEDENAVTIEADSTRLDLYKKSVTGELVKIVNAIDTIQKQQSPKITQSRRKKSKPNS
ncbi:MAG: hypothetical protein AAFU54_18800 [Chloroflexota bacterium]